MTDFEHPYDSSQKFGTRDARLCIGEQTIFEIAEHVGGTPYFAYSKSMISDRIAAIREALPDDVSIHYAVKANPFPSLVDFVAHQVDGLDVASVGELRIALDTNVASENIGFAGPGKSMDELEAAIQAGIVLKIESRIELERVSALGQQLEVVPNVALRINPDFELRGSGMKMSGRSTPFGIDAEIASEVLTTLPSLPLNFTGFHIFAGSQCLDTEAICETQRKCVALAMELARYSPTPPKTINIGGGLGIPYFPGSSPIDLDRIGMNLHKLVNDMARQSFEPRLVLELGRYIVGESGVYVCRVVDKKVSRGKTFLVTDGGMHHHLAASGNLGQVLRRNYPLLVANKVGEEPTEIVTVVGRLCTPLDILGRDVKLTRADVGDYIAIFQSGAYGLTSSPTAFLSHPMPSEILL